MPKQSQRIPSYRLHKASGQARVIVDGRHTYLGRFESPESRQAYRRLLAELDSLAGREVAPNVDDAESEPTLVRAIIWAYWQFAENYYSKNGRPTKELGCMRDALGPLRDIYGSTPVSEFGPKSLKAVRQQMIELDWSRGVINKHVNRIRRVFKWAVAEELVPPSIHQGLQAVPGLRRGRTSARETEPVKPVADLYVTLVLPFVSPQVSTMIKVQRMTGMRPGEVVQLRAHDIDMSGDVWLFEPAEHKNDWREHVRQVPLGPQAQELLEPFLSRPATDFLFTPREAEEWRYANRPPYSGRTRKTPVYPSETRRRDAAKRKSRNRSNKRPLRDRYDRDSYRRAIEYGFKKARKVGVMIPHWFPNQLRHSLATEVRKRHGVEAAQVLLGHARADVTQVYAERDLEMARRIVQEIG